MDYRTRRDSNQSSDSPLERSYVEGDKTPSANPKLTKEKDMNDVVRRMEKLTLQDSPDSCDKNSVAPDSIKRTQNTASTVIKKLFSEDKESLNSDTNWGNRQLSEQTGNVRIKKVDTKKSS